MELLIYINIIIQMKDKLKIQKEDLEELWVQWIFLIREIFVNNRLMDLIGIKKKLVLLYFVV